MKSHLVILVHGYFKGRHDMSFLESGLKNKGYDVLSVALPTTFKSLSDCCKSLKLQIDALNSPHSKYSFVGHSMGGLIIQEYLDNYRIPNLGRCIFIATPFKGSKLADISSSFPLVDSVFKPLQVLTSNVERISLTSRFNEVPEIGVIAGTKNNLWMGKIFLSQISDGRVEVESTKIDNMSDYIELPYGHKEIHHREETLKQVESFLQSGYFNRTKCC
ncbi:alpha/beta hydrolase [Leptodesmis sp.]|uniref:alpha/beta hydrolase n=1 Tax=Leptodesmis sp. TaxID=3100501 RepID=UPI0040535511